MSFSAPFRQTVERLERIQWQGNDVLHWGYALAALVGTWVLLRAAHFLLSKHLKKVAERSQTRADDIISDVVGATRWVFHAAIALEVARQFIEVPKPAVPFLNGTIVVGLFVQLGLWIRQAVLSGTRYWVSKHAESPGHTATVASGINFMLNVLVWVAVALLILTNLGVQVSAVIAGLGVGGIAAALALQSILADIFAGLSMYFDRPFDIGDFIVIDAHNGTVIKIGVRTTRLRSPEGDELVVPNGDLVKARIKNYGRLEERRVQFNFSIEYGHTTEQVQEVQKIAREVVEGRQKVRFDRAHLKGFTDNGLEYEVAYFVLTPDYNFFMDTQQAINVALYERFEKGGLRFAFNALHLKDQPPPAPEKANTGSPRAA